MGASGKPKSRAGGEDEYSIDDNDFEKRYGAKLDKLEKKVEVAVPAKVANVKATSGSKTIGPPTT